MMQSDLSGSSNYGQGEKVAIPKLKRGPPPPYKKSERNNNNNNKDRVTRACNSCRQRKTKCSGDIPRCTNCETYDLNCVYEQARKDRLREATQLNQTTVALLRDLSERVNEDDRKRINDALEDVEGYSIAHTPVPSVKSLGKRSRGQSSAEDEQSSGQHGEAFVTASVGSNEDLDFLREDLLRNRESRETGYVGQNSEVQWLRSVQRQTEYSNTDPNAQQRGPPGASRNAANERSEALHQRMNSSKQGAMQHTTDATFYLDNDDIEIDIVVDPYIIPDPETAEQLFNCYRNTVHSSFPLISMSFETQLGRYFESVKRNRPHQIPDRWRATMNLVFAIGAKYSHLIGAQWRGDERDHLVYMTRAVNLLGLKNTVMIISAPDLGLIQATGALAFYFLAVGHVSRAWIMIGISIRLALAVGLHLRNEDPSADGAKKEGLARMWWCLHSIECLVSSITGRPPIIVEEQCTIPVPQNPIRRPSRDSSASGRATRIRRDSSSPYAPASSSTTDSGRRAAAEDQFLPNYIGVTRISQKVLAELYSPRTAAESWEYVQTKITELLNELEEWAKAAVPGVISPEEPSQYPDVARQRFLLRMYYWSTRILITRPCVCRIDERISNESDSSTDFNSKMAEACIVAARELTRIFPDQPDTTFIYSQGPWWGIVHIIMQSIAVLLLEMTYEGNDLKDKKDDIMECIKKMIRWLRAMQANDPVAKRAYRVVWKILKTCAPSLAHQANELLAEDVGPPHPDQTNGYLPESFEQAQSVPWQPEVFADSLAGHPAAFDSNFLQQQAADSLSGHGYASDPYFMTEQMQMPMAFGNPFFTTFDQGVPFVNMQDLWLNPAPSRNLDTDLAGMAISGQGQGFQQQTQQMEQMEQMEPMEFDPRMEHPPSQ